MTKEEIITMAEGAGFFVKENEAYSPSSQEDHELTPHLEAFAKLVAEHEREECAVVAEEWVCGCGRSNCIEGDLRSQDIAEAIRARGQE
jgi:hypothetical protein